MSHHCGIGRPTGLKRLSCLIAVGVALAGCAAYPVTAPFSAALQRPRGPIRAGEVLVVWQAPPDQASLQGALASVGGAVIDEVGPRTLLRVPDGAELAACRTLRDRPGIAHAEPNRVVRSQHVGAIRPRARHLMRTPNDRALSPEARIAGMAVAWGLTAIRASEAWDVTMGDPEVKIAIIDTGVDMAHPDLAANIDPAGARNFVEPNQPPDDDFGHGTHVAGIAAAVGDNSAGAAGVAYRAKIMPIRVLGVDGTGDTWDTIAAIEFATQRGAAVINMSLGSSDGSEAEAEAIRRATEAGTVVVAAAGNEAGDGNYLEYPASYPGVISVAAVGPDHKRAAFSNYNSWVTIAAPGVDIFSTVPTRMSPVEPYAYLSGTSMAAPFVAGAAALLASQYPSWTPAQITERLKRMSRELTPPGDTIIGFDVYFGAGLLDAGKALGR